VSVGKPALLPVSISALFTQSSRVCAEQPIFAAIDWQAVQREECSASCAHTNRPARSRTPGENLFVVLLVMAPPYGEVGASGKPGAVQKKIGRNAMAASGRRHRLARFETLLNDCQLLLGCPPPAADITRQQFNVSVLVRHKPVLKPVLEPFCLC